MLQVPDPVPYISTANGLRGNSPQSGDTSDDLILDHLVPEYACNPQRITCFQMNAVDFTICYPVAFTAEYLSWYSGTRDPAAAGDAKKRLAVPGYIQRSLINN